MRVYGLTGGTGSGKTEAGRRFVEQGIPVIDADRIGHEVTAPGGEAASAVIAAFGDSILTGGDIDRKKLGALVFADREARLTLNQLVHPLILAETMRRCARFFEQGYRVVLVDAALLGESGRVDDALSGLILVSCPEQVRLHRLMTSRGMSEADAKRQIAAQSDPEAKRGIASHVIENAGDIAHLHSQVDAIARELLSMPN